MKINIQKIAYRAIPVLTALVVIVSCVATPAFGATVKGRTIIDYNDYVSNIDVDGDNDLVTVTLPPYYYGVQKVDSTGRSYKEGVDLGQLVCKNDGIADSAGVYFPGAGVTNTFLDLSNIPNGSIFYTKGKVWFEPVFTDSNSVFEGYYYSALQYWDENFNVVGSDISPRFDIMDDRGAFVYDLTWRVSVDKPDNAVYCATFFMIVIHNVVFEPEPVTFWFDFDIPKLQMSINSLYRLQEQTGKTNKLLQNLIDGTPEQGAVADSVTGSLGSAGDAMQDAAGELEGIGDQLAAVDKPDMDSVNVSVDGLVPYQAMLAYTAPIQVLWENPTLLGMLSIVIVLVIVSWVFFGKKV